MKQAFAFTGRFSTFRHRIVSKINIISADRGNPRGTTVKALWDTGASETVISRKVVDFLSLKVEGKRVVRTPLGFRKVCGRAKTRICVVLGSYPVEIDAVVDDYPNSEADCDVTLGLDFITKGDFSITHDAGQLMFSFAYPPPCFPIDYTSLIPKVNPDIITEECEDVDPDEESGFISRERSGNILLEEYVSHLNKIVNGKV